MTTNPLVLYYAGPDPIRALDARAGAEELLKRWPGAEVREYTDLESQCVTDGKWLLGCGAAGNVPTYIDPTPDASIVMRVWLELYGVTVLGEDGSGCATSAAALSPPTWLRYLDDAVCGRFVPHGEDAVMWEAVQSHATPERQLGQIRRAAESESYRHGLVTEGSAILRARERQGHPWRDAVLAALGVDYDPECHTPEEIGALVLEIREIGNHCQCARLRAERDELRAGLAEALEYVARIGIDLTQPEADDIDDDDTWCGVCGRWLDVEIDGHTGHGKSCRYVALCELAGAGRSRVVSDGTAADGQQTTTEGVDCG